MSRPTKEIIELSKKLHEFGHRQLLNEDGWYVDSGDIPMLNYGNSLPKDFYRTNEIRVPSLRQGLAWLKERFKYRIEVWGHVRNEFWICRWGNTDDWIKGDTPHEAVLKAMVKVLENQ